MSVAERTHQEPAGGQRTADLATVARGGTLNFVGALSTGILQFALVVALTHALPGKSAAGAFFAAIAIFLILVNAAELGADTGLTRMIPRLRVLNRVADIRTSLRVGLWPSLLGGLAAAIVVFAFAPAIAGFFTTGQDADVHAVATYLRVLMVFLPLATAGTVAIAATRGFGTMLPNALVDRMGKAGLQLVLVVAAVLAVGNSSVAIGLGYGLPFLATFTIAMVWLRRLLRRVEAKALASSEPARPLRQMAIEFWRFTGPRGITGVLQVTTLWLGTLMVSKLVSTADAAVYTATTRYLVAGSVVNIAIIHVVGPKLSELLSAGAMSRARDVYQVATCWQMMLAWPIYLTLIAYAPVLLSVFGHGFGRGETSLLVLSVAMLVATGVGPVDIVLLMGGRSFWNLFNVAGALSVNVVLSLLLIPIASVNITGAAIAWAGSILFNNVAPLLEVRAFLRLHPFGRGFPVVAGASVLCFLVFGLAMRRLLGTSVASFALFAPIATTMYALFLWKFRARIDLEVVRESFLMRRARRQALARG